MRLLPFLFLLFLLPAGVHAQREVALFPHPQSILRYDNGYLWFTPGDTLEAYAPHIARHARRDLDDFLRSCCGINLLWQDSFVYDAYMIHLDTMDLTDLPGIKPGYYNLRIERGHIRIYGDEAGLFYAVQTLRQLAEPVTWDETLQFMRFPEMEIVDAPRFHYRGMMLDVARHFQPVSYIKQVIDRLAKLKFNYFHWHLTDDQGWRLAIESYPRLAEVAAWRDGTIIGRYPGTGNDHTPHGGYYSRGDIEEVVRYAAERYITIVPEIEMPGHASAAIAAYPWLSCFPEEETVIPYHPSEASMRRGGKKVQESWGVYEDVFVPREETFRFLEEVLDEVVTLFPGPYVHIGGDECPKANWKRSSFCQALMREEGLQDEHELQSYFIRRIGRHLASHGRQLIGWDEILEGGLPEGAVVMSWRGEEGGIEAAMQGHQVIMSPTSHVYLDYAQSPYEDSLVIGGYLPLEKVYAYDPVPAALRDGPYEEAILGAQANVWTEYMPNTAKMEYMMYPRLVALSEAVWTMPEIKDWSRFERSLPVLFDRLQQEGIHHSRAYYHMQSQVLPRSEEPGLRWLVRSHMPGSRIVFTTPAGDTLTPADGSLSMDTSGTYTATLLDDRGQVVQRIDEVFDLHLGTTAHIEVSSPPSSTYPGRGGVQGLLNGIRSRRGFNSPEWCGWQGKDLVATLDLGNAIEVDVVRLHILESPGSWIYRPRRVSLSLSLDGEHYAQAFEVETLEPFAAGDLRTVEIPVRGRSARYLRLEAIHYGTIPDGMPGAGHPAWLFVDEIEVR